MKDRERERNMRCVRLPFPLSFTQVTYSIITLKSTGRENDDDADTKQRRRDV